MQQIAAGIGWKDDLRQVAQFEILRSSHRRNHLRLMKKASNASARLIRKSIGAAIGKANINIHEAVSPAEGSCLVPEIPASSLSTTIGMYTADVTNIAKASASEEINGTNLLSVI
jgi:hypothetical protein